MTEGLEREAYKVSDTMECLDNVPNVKRCVSDDEKVMSGRQSGNA